MTEMEIVGAQCLAFRTQMLARKITRIYDTALRPHGLTMAQFSLLNGIGSMQPFDLRMFAALFGYERTTLIRNTERLRANGLVEEAPDETGLRLTEAGRRVLSAAFSSWDQAQADVKNRLGAETWQTTFEAIDHAAHEL